MADKGMIYDDGGLDFEGQDGGMDFDTGVTLVVADSTLGLTCESPTLPADFSVDIGDSDLALTSDNTDLIHSITLGSDVYGSEIVLNGDMETGSGDPWLPTGWALWGADPGEITADSNDKHGGSYALHFDVSASNEGCRTNIFSAIEKNVYELTVWIKRISGQFEIVVYDGTALNPTNFVFSNGYSTWTKVTKRVTMETAGDVARIVFQSYGNAAEWLIDDLSFKRISSSLDTSINLISEQLDLSQHFTIIANDSTIDLKADTANLVLALDVDWGIDFDDVGLDFVDDGLVFKDKRSEIILIPQGATFNLTSEHPSLIQSNVLAVNDSTIDLTSEQPQLSISVFLAVDNSQITVTSEQPALIQSNILAVNSSNIAITSSQPALIQSNVLAVNNSNFGIAVPETEIWLSLVVNNSTLAVTSENIDLVQSYNLAIDNSILGIIADNVTLEYVITGFVYSFVISDSNYEIFYNTSSADDFYFQANVEIA